MPALVIIVDEYAELADEAPAAMTDTDSIARLGRPTFAKTLETGTTCSYQPPSQSTGTL